ncbi:hypothetical protein KIN20_033440 [Parelaphostrongylus tenuis]|uniref:Uncharacterized protein n=1 Tax=Parelaphostrongylus tenuis TaxID=148309 RepID=A0AAD5WI94_PARTN|nr:hypothetical protein KIN20_033440 [Parelaphostrongylus tenuis]
MMRAIPAKRTYDYVLLLAPSSHWKTYKEQSGSETAGFPFETLANLNKQQPSERSPEKAKINVTNLSLLGYGSA